ncbi:MAG: prepilin-type N-terminal cleavage/methylation domain-containing protein [Candidatus Omnitrophica bacterium]|nr:prepilin-type N-terminal cleavage/methylation domain-containing protein [Candidatus Omnitrophota bacterium]
MRKGFTLIELIVVIAIIAILAAIIAPNAFKAIEKAKIAKTIAELRVFKTAAHSLYSDTGRWPGSGGIGPIAQWVYLDNGLIWPRTPAGLNSSLFDNDDGVGNTISGWDGPYLDRRSSKSAWGGTYAMYKRYNGFPQTGSSAGDLTLVITSICYGSLNSVLSNRNCPLSEELAEIINGKIEGDNDLRFDQSTAGNFRKFLWANSGDTWEGFYHFMIGEDVL